MKQLLQEIDVCQFRAICYADIFDFPLTRSEIVKYQIASIKKSKKHFDAQVLQQSRGYYFLKGRGNIVSLRKKRESYSHKKVTIANKHCRIFKLIPTIQSIFVTGAVAAQNARKQDDIDILVITKTGWIWTTRLLVIMLANIVGIRRKPGEKKIADKLCFNMFIDEDHLAIPVNERDVFSANEIARMKLLWGRGAVSSRFYYENKWIRSFLPNFIIPVHGKKTVHQGGPLQFIEFIMRSLQLFYMKFRRTNEVITDGYVRFHPNDAREWILEEYMKRLKKYHVEI
jgi:hypothetical protein